MADSIMRLMSYNGIFYIISKGPQALELLRDAKKAIKVLVKALESNDKHDNFNSYLWMSKAYAKQKKYNKALEEINKSLKIYPDSKWAIYLHNNYSKELK